MADEKVQKIYGKYIKELPQVTEVNDTDDIIVEDSTPITNRTKLGVIFDAIKSRIASTWKFSELGNKTILTYITELKAKAPCPCTRCPHFFRLQAMFPAVSCSS